MPAETPALVRSFSVGRRVCTLTVPHLKPGGTVCMAAEWAPDMPKRLSRRELQQYREGRDKAMAELARRAGGMGLVIPLIMQFM